MLTVTGDASWLSTINYRSLPVFKRTFHFEKHIVFHFWKKSVRTRRPTLRLHFVSRSYPRILEGSSPIASQSPPGPARTPPVLYLFSFPFFWKKIMQVANPNRAQNRFEEK